MQRMRLMASLVGIAAGAGSIAGCATPAGPIFPDRAQPLVFPPAPDTPRVRYVGQLATEADLKPAKSALAGLGEALFGKDSTRSMLAPYAIATAGERLFVCDGSAQVLHVFDLATREYEQWKPDADPKLHPDAHHFSQPVGIAIDFGEGGGEGASASASRPRRIFVSDSVAATIFLFDAEGHSLGDIGYGTLKRPCGIAFDAKRDRLLVADSGHHQLLAMSPEGTLLQAVGTRGSDLGEFNFPTNVAIDAEGLVYVSDSLNFRVQVLDESLKPVRQIGKLGDMPGYFAQPKGVAMDSERHVYVVDSQFEAVQVFTVEGQLLMSFGEEGAGPGQFWLPSGIHIDAKDRIWIADSYNRRVQVFDYLREVPAEIPLPTTSPTDGGSP